MNNVNQLFKLYNVLKNGEPKSTRKLCRAIDSDKTTLAVKICELRKLGGIIVATRRDGHIVIEYQGTDFSSVEIPVKFAAVEKSVKERSKRELRVNLALK